MTDVMQQAASWLNSQRHTYTTKAVQYVRGAITITINATPGETVFRLDDGYGGVIRTVSRDFIVQTEDLVLDGELTRPVRGDRIHEGEIEYEVLSPGDEPEWRFSDSERLAIRIHTKEVS